VAKVLTAANCAEVLPRFFRLSRREAELVAASIGPAPEPPTRDVVTAPRATPAESPPPNSTAFRPAETPPPNATGSQTTAAHRDQPASTMPSTIAPPASIARDAAKPLSSDLARLHITVSRRFLAKLEAARDALSHARPSATTEEILEAGLDLLLAERAKRHGLVAKPRNVARPAKEPSGKAVPAPVKREVWTRAGGRCEWRLHSGERCGSTVRLEYDHVVPRAHGGPSTTENLRLVCREHNDLAARQVFGDEWMERLRGNRPSATEAPDA
jgi:hypothetical protein